MFRAFCVGAALLAPTVSVAHEGEDHGAEPGAVAAAAPTAAATSDRYEAVLRLTDGQLRLYLDDYRTNAPVTRARVGALIGGRELRLPEIEPGTYAAPTGQPFPAGETEIGLSIEAAAGADLLSATVTVPAATVADDHAHFEWRPFLIGAAAMLGLVLLGLAALRLLRRRRAIVPAFVLLTGGFGLFAPPPAGAHEGEDHGEPPAAAVTGGERAVRLPDGQVYLPKPSQRILGVRTIVAAAGGGAATATMPGVVVADPSRYARVATARGGRLLPLGGGLPRLGQRVAAGQALFRVAPSLSATEAASSAAELRSLDREIMLAGLEASRLGALRGIVAEAEIRRANASLAGLRAQRSAAAAPVNTAETVRAPFAGVVARVTGSIGEIAAPGTVVVELQGDGALLVEAVAPPALQGRGLGTAEAVGRDGRRVGLALVGRSPGVEGGVERLQFRPRSAVGLRVGEPVGVEAALTAGPERRGIVVPAAAVVRNAAGETIVWSKRRPELFAPRPVRVVALPGGLRLLAAGVAPGERIVAQAAGLIAQIR